jgi:hypothetical protein
VVCDLLAVQTLLQDNQINFEFIDVETTEGASEFVEC